LGYEGRVRFPSAAFPAKRLSERRMKALDRTRMSMRREMKRADALIPPLHIAVSDREK
jgi:hypothetical protein